MNIINPNEIGSKISTLIAESEEIFYVVSPYLDLSQWKKILINLERAVDRGVKVIFYFREIKEKDYQILNKLGVELYKIKGLHTKLYLNEKEVIVSSMNLYEFSDLYSIDIAIQFNETKDYNKIFDYFQKYIKSTNDNKKYQSKISKANLKELYEYLSVRFSNFRINATDTYLFSKNLNPVFDMFIGTSKIGFKYPVKNLSSDKIKELDDDLREIFKDSINYREYNTCEETKYCLWEIDIESGGYLDFVDVITDAQKIKIRPNPNFRNLV